MLCGIGFDAVSQASFMHQITQGDSGAMFVRLTDVEAVMLPLLEANTFPQCTTELMMKAFKVSGTNSVCWLNGPTRPPTRAGGINPLAVLRMCVCMPPT